MNYNELFSNKYSTSQRGVSSLTQVLINRSRNLELASRSDIDMSDLPISDYVSEEVAREIERRMSVKRGYFDEAHVIESEVFLSEVRLTTLSQLLANDEYRTKTTTFFMQTFGLSLSEVIPFFIDECNFQEQSRYLRALEQFCELPARCMDEIELAAEH